jgi:hypothetical protein
MYLAQAQKLSRGCDRGVVVREQAADAIMHILTGMAGLLTAAALTIAGFAIVSNNHHFPPLSPTPQRKDANTLFTTLFTKGRLANHRGLSSVRSCIGQKMRNKAPSVFSHEVGKSDATICHSLQSVDAVRLAKLFRTTSQAFAAETRAACCPSSRNFTEPTTARQAPPAHTGWGQYRAKTSFRWRGSCDATCFMAWLIPRAPMVLC